MEDRGKYPYLQKPPHLTNEEFNLISEVIVGFQDFNTSFPEAEKCKNEAVKGRLEMLEQTQHCRSLEARLSNLEKTAIRTRNLAKRKDIEGMCKKFRELINERKELAVYIEQHANRLEGAARRIEQNVQDGLISKARAVLVMCDVVRIRREKENQQDRSNDN